MPGFTDLMITMYMYNIYVCVCAQDMPVSGLCSTTQVINVGCKIYLTNHMLRVDYLQMNGGWFRGLHQQQHNWSISNRSSHQVGIDISKNF